LGDNMAERMIEANGVDLGHDAVGVRVRDR
jgi:hypothetical protein